MVYAFVIVFVLLALAAAMFAVWPLVRGQRTRATWLLAGAIGVLVLGIGAGTYLIVGSPELALRSSTVDEHDWRSIVAALVTNARAHPQDVMAWVMLGRGYTAVHDEQDAALAFRRALPLAPPRLQPALLSSIGESLTRASGGAVTPEAEEAFATALKIDPHDNAGRYYLGLAYAQRRDNARAIALWQSLLADLPANFPQRGELVDRIASLSAQSGQGPDIGAMVASLAARLKTQPNDPQGWQRLVRAYAVLGDTAKARAALADARTALKNDAASLAALDAEARQLGL